MKSVLLHICCGVCAIECIDRLQQEGFMTGGLFFNPNIHPKEEYERREKELSIVERESGVTIHRAPYTPSAWHTVCDPFAKEKEGGARCRKCFSMRLKETYAFAKENSFDYFTTTLTISPHKKSSVIFDIAGSISDTFLAVDFKKKDGFKRTQALSKKHGIYHQTYCGCVYSINHKA